MTLVLHKLLPLVVSPLGLVVLLVSLSVILRRRGPALIGLIMLLVCALPMTADQLWAALEADYPYRSIESTENADAVVVLSGMLEWLETEGSVVPLGGGRPPTALRGGRPPQRRQGAPDHIHPGTVPVDRPPTRGRAAREARDDGYPGTADPVDRYRHQHRRRGCRGEVRDGPRGHETHHPGDLGVPHATREDAVRAGRYRVRPVPDRLQVSGPTKQLAQPRTQRGRPGQDIGRGPREFIGRIYYRTMFSFET